MPEEAPRTDGWFTVPLKLVLLPQTVKRYVCQIETVSDVLEPRELSIYWLHVGHVE